MVNWSSHGNDDMHAQDDEEFYCTCDMTNEDKEGCVMVATLLCVILFAMLILMTFKSVILIFQSGTVLMESYSNGN